MFEQGSFCEFFSRLTGFQPYPYQVETARMLYEEHNVILRAPTGAGETLSVLAPFLFGRKTLGLSRLIYALPLRSLAHGVFAEAKSLAEKIGLLPRSVTIQTGDNPDDPFFDTGTMIITHMTLLLSRSCF
ncbi:MAG TPA: DEAD/DEAH box helicase [Firmicutes bacterium]|nr:DEAD/DEAH box helicase [Bacillota bacterium]